MSKTLTESYLSAPGDEHKRGANRVLRNTLKDPLLTLYRWISQSQRTGLARHFSTSGTWPAIVLFYHRVAIEAHDPWSMQAEDFLDQVDWLQQHADMVSLGEIQRAQLAGRRERLQVAITFDDGYFETVELAAPMLIERNIPFTYFVSTSFAETGQSFPHDSLAGYDHRPNTRAQVEWLGQQGVEIGSHTQTHVNFSLSLSAETIRTEIVDSRRILQDWTGQPVRYFSFPYGMKQHISQAAVDAVHEAGYAGFVSAWGEYNQMGDDPYHLKRVHADPQWARFLNWMTIDPRKLRIRQECPVRSSKRDIQAAMEIPSNPVLLFPTINTLGVSGSADVPQH